MSYIEKSFEKLWGSMVESFNIDMIEGKIKIDVRTIENEIETTYKVVFEDVTSYCWIDTDDTETERFKYIELTSIMLKNSEINTKGISDIYYNQGFKSFKDKSKYEVNDSAKANILLEIWNSPLFIKAKKVNINEETFDLAKESN